MRIIKLICIFILSLDIFLPHCKADNISDISNSMAPDSIAMEKISRALSSVYSDSFPAAVACIDSLIADDDKYWPAYIIKAGIIYTSMTDDELYDREKYFKSLIDTSLAGLDNYLKENKNDKWAVFFKGTALGYLAVWEGHHGSWFNAVIKGIKAGKMFSQAIKTDSLFYEAYLGLGTLHYWRSAKLGFFRKLPFVSDKREQGIGELKLAVDRSELSSVSAAIGLCWIYIDSKEYQETIKLTDDLIKQGYSGRQVLWPGAIAEFKRGNAPGTIEMFTKIRAGLLKKGDQNFLNLIICGYCLGMAYYWMGDYQTSLDYFDEILNYEITPEIEKKASKKLKAANKYKKKIAEKINK